MKKTKEFIVKPEDFDRFLESIKDKDLSKIQVIGRLEDGTEEVIDLNECLERKKEPSRND